MIHNNAHPYNPFQKTSISYLQSSQSKAGRVKSGRNTSKLSRYVLKRLIKDYLLKVLIYPDGFLLHIYLSLALTQP